MQAVNVGPTLISISATGVNVQPQALNVSPDLIVVGPYDTTIAGQVAFPATPVLHLPPQSIISRALWSARCCCARFVQALRGWAALATSEHLPCLMVRKVLLCTLCASLAWLGIRQVLQWRTSYSQMSSACE